MISLKKIWKTEKMTFAEMNVMGVCKQEVPSMLVAKSKHRLPELPQATSLGQSSLERS